MYAKSSKFALGPGKRMKSHSHLNKKGDTVSNHDDEVISTARESTNKLLIEPEPSGIKGIGALGKMN